MERPVQNNRPWLPWYKTAAWLRLRKWQLQHEPLCRFCKNKGIITAADTVDHIKAHKGDKNLFFNRENLQSLCKPCHSSTKQAMESETIKGCNEKGQVPQWQNQEGLEAIQPSSLLTS